MTTIQIFDPALCCSTGVCGVDVDQELARFAADVEWVRHLGVQIERFNLAQQPMAFVNQPAVKAALECSGPSSLPLTVVDGNVQCSGRYPSREELAAWASELSAKPAVRPETAALLKRSNICCSPANPADPSRTGCCG